MLRRRRLLGMITAAIGAPGLAAAQPAAHLPRVALVDPGEPARNMREGGHPHWHAFLEEMRRLDRVEGEGIVIDRWSGLGLQNEALRRMMAGLVASAPAVVVTRGLRATSLVREATSTIPIVGLATLDTLVDSLARPGGNVTGISLSGGFDLYGKQIQLLREAMPEPAAISWLGSRDFWETSPITRATQTAAGQLGVALSPALIEMPITEAGIAATFAAIAGLAGGVFVSSDPTMSAWADTIAGLAAATGLPGISLQPDYARAGLLMSYGPDFSDAFRRAAVYVDRILDGGDPAEMPVEQPTRFECVVNLRAAARLGITLPAGIMLMATEFVE